MSRAIAVDFDGVLHSYTSKWEAPWVIPDPPVPGAIQFLRDLVDAGYRVVIFTTRGDTIRNAQAIQEWLTEYGLEMNYLDRLEVSNKKGDASVYIDDRAYRFEGTFPTMSEVAAHHDPWWKR